MKKIKNWMIVGIIAVLFITGCGAKGASSSNTVSQEMAYDSAFATESAASPAEAPAVMEEAFEEEWDIDEGGTGIVDSTGIENVNTTNQKLIKTVDMSMETKDFDGLIQAVTDEVNKRGGYVESSEVNGNSYYGGGTRNAWLRLRIPADQLDGFVNTVGELGNVTWKNEYVEDITLQYVDVESHKMALETEQTRLLELLEKAENMEDIILIETRLSEIRYELQSYESRLRTMDNKVSYSTVSVNVYEVQRMTQVEERTFFQKIGDRLSDNLYRISRDAQDFVIWLISSIPYLVIWAIIIILIVVFVRKVLFKKKGRILGRRKDKLQEMMKKSQEENKSEKEEDLKDK